MSDTTTIGFTPEEIEYMKQGGTIGGSMKTGTTAGASVYTPQVSTPIEGYGKSIRPRVAGQDPNADGGLVTKPDLSKHISNHEEEMARIHALEQDKRDHQRQLQEALEPSKLLAQLNAMDRKLRKLEKANKTLTDTVKTLQEASKR